MPTATINGRPCEFEGRPTILQVALDNDIAIPHYCYHPGLSVVASCRICLAEVAAPDPRQDNKVSVMPKLMPTCQTIISEGMEVDTNSPKSAANQKAVMEYLLINHPIDCPVCDQAGECSLQDYSYRYGNSVSRFSEDKMKQPKKDIGPNVLLYADRCIMCTRCVRFTREITGTGELGVFGRGASEQIDVFPGKPIDNELSGNVIDICPVGALLDKDFLFQQRVWYLKRTPSIDGITASGDNIWIEHNEGVIHRVKPRENDHVNQWWISDEIRYGWKFIHSKERLRMPYRLQFGQQVECDWDRAYNEVKQGLCGAVSEHGKGSVALVISPMLTCEEAHVLGQFVRALDDQAVLVTGPVMIKGENKTFPGGYTVVAEKCPNLRGVQRVLRGLGGQVIDYDTFLTQLADKKKTTGAVVLTANYPWDWTTRDLTKALSKPFTVLIDTLLNPFTAKADVVLPSATWVEKSGTFENVNNRLQAFDQAISIIEMAKSEGQIAMDLAAACGVGNKQKFDVHEVRRKLGGIFEQSIHRPSVQEAPESDMKYVELI
ncbi:MAG: ferredoxin [Phycisphaeraceae bacterium]|nr:ferredoxin [Phycisphaeraceae bacterium]|tara:strand:+ start:2007 stop:3647 length:1641 start_codon:yes stop_codon:yes gene_type:complete